MTSVRDTSGVHKTLAEEPTIPGVMEPHGWLDQIELTEARRSMPTQDRSAVASPPPLPPGGEANRRHTPPPQPPLRKSSLTSRGQTLTDVPEEEPVAPADELTGIMDDILATEQEEEKRRKAGDKPRVTKEEWFREVFEAGDWLALQPAKRRRHVEREVDFVVKALKLPPDAEILDIGCGDGAHCVALAKKGYRVTGLDLSRSLLERALVDANKAGVSVRFIEADMRELNFERKFDAVICLNSTFGYFDDAENLRVLRAMSRALKPRGQMILDVVNRDWVVSSVPRRMWWEARERMVLEEIRFEHINSRLQVQRSILREGYPNWEQHLQMRAYAVHEMPSLLHVTGMRATSVTGDLAHPGAYLGPSNRRLLVHALRDRAV